jgi:hypothetical protein
MKTFALIGAGCIVALLVIGFFTFIVADNLWKDKRWYQKYKLIAGLSLIALSAICFISWGIALALVFFDGVS